MFQIPAPDTGPCRHVLVPTCEMPGSTERTSNVPALACFRMKKRDVLDFGIDFGDWLEANGGSRLEGVAWGVATDSPSTPALSGTSFIDTGKTSVVVTPAVDAAPGDAYYLDCTATVAEIPAAVGQLAVPARTLTRRIHIVIEQG